MTGRLRCTLFGPDGPTDFQMVLPRVSRGSEPTARVRVRETSDAAETGSGRLTEGGIVVVTDVALALFRSDVC
jgi:hypothetical protein